MEVHAKEFPEGYPEDSIRANFLGVMNFLGKLPGSRMRKGDFLCVSTGVAVSDLNYACISNPDFPVKIAESAIEEAISFFSVDGMPLRWCLTATAGSQAIETKILARGFKKTSDVSCMAVDLGNLNEVKSPADFGFNPVEDNSQLETWAEISSMGFGYDPDVRKKYIEMVRNFDIDYNHQLFIYIGYLMAKPVATSMLYVGEGIAGLYWISSIQETGAEDLDTVMAYRTMMEAKRMGYPMAFLQSSAKTVKFHQRLGFEEYPEVFSIYQK